MLRAFILICIKGYQVLLSPFLGNHCRFLPTCSQYTADCFKTFTFPKALWYSMKRISKCHPLHFGGFDPVKTVSKEKKR